MCKGNCHWRAGLWFDWIENMFVFVNWRRKCRCHRYTNKALWLKEVTWLGKSNQRASFQCSYVTLKFVYDIGSSCVKVTLSPRVSVHFSETHKVWKANMKRPVEAEDADRCWRGRFGISLTLCFLIILALFFRPMMGMINNLTSNKRGNVVQCDQMARLFVQHLGIYVKGNSPNSIIFLPKYGQNVAKY